MLEQELELELDNEPRYSTNHNGSKLINFTVDELLAVNGIGQVTVDDIVAAHKLNIVNEKATAHITESYPTGKQLTVARTGSVAQQDKMNTFIDGILAWANSENPQDADLLAIVA